MEFLLLIPSVLLGGILVYVLRTQDRDRESFLRAVQAAIKEIDQARARDSATISEMAERIQRPENPVPSSSEDVDPLPEPETPPEFQHAGQIYPDSELDNGGPPNG